MSHHHFCDFAGHRWECDDPECECFDHNTSMEDGDHSQCRIELRACPPHKDEAACSIADAMLSEPDAEFTQKWQERPQCQCGCAETEMNKFVGFCMHCTHSYVTYGPEIEDSHFANYCPGAPEELRESARVRLA